MKGRVSMKCPYCAEEIQEEAVVCRHCDRDFGLFKPLLLKVGALEKRIAALRAPAQSTADELTGVAFQLPLLTVVFACVVLTSGFFYSFFRPTPPAPEGNLPYLLAIIAPASLLGFAVGRLWRGGSLPVFFESGLGVGFLNLIAVGWILDSLASSPHFNWPWAILLFVVGQPLLFTTAAFIGGSLKERKYPDEEPRKRTPWEVRLEKWAKGSKNLQIILGLLAQVASIVLAVFAYFGFSGG